MLTFYFPIDLFAYVVDSDDDILNFSIKSTKSVTQSKPSSTFTKAIADPPKKSESQSNIL